MNGTYFFTLTSTGGAQNAENPGGGGQVEAVSYTHLTLPTKA